MNPQQAVAALVVTGVALSVGLAEEARLDPAERCDVNLWGANWRLAVRFDLARVKNAEKATRATLFVTAPTAAGKTEVRPVAGPGPIEVCPIAADWGGLSAAFKKRELEGVWRPEDLGQEGYKVAAELWRLGEADWTWAVRGVTKWQRPGGDFAAPVAALNPAKDQTSADLTALAKSWLAGPSENFGVMVKMATEAKEPTLRGAVVYLTLDGPGVAVDDALRLDDPPTWLPKTYKVQHPRLPYPTKEWLDALKADPKRLADLVKTADSFDPEKGVARLLGSLVLAQRLAPTSERARLLARAVDAAFPNHGGYSICYGLATLYDWGYDLLTAEDRRRLAWRLERMCTGEEEGCESTIVSPYNDVGTSRFGCGLLWAALATYPDLPVARKHVWRAKSYYIDTSLPVWHQVFGDDGGYWHEMHGYYLGTCIGEALARCVSAWSSATGEDLYAKNPWLENWLYFAMYSTRPDHYRIRIGDIKCSEYYYGEDPVCLASFPALVRRYDNPYGRWWLERCGMGRADGVRPTEDPWGEPVPKDAPVKSWDALPPVRHSDGLGVVNLRSDWSEDATYVWFKCGPSYWSHSHYDSGTFAIYKRGALAVDAGNYTAGYGSEHYAMYARLSIAHNVVTVTDPGEKPGRWGQRNLPNDGGQRLTAGEHGTPVPYSRAEWEKRREEFDTGRIVAFQTTPAFTYVVGDVTRAYTNAASGTGHVPSRSKRVRKFLRSIVFLPPDHLVMFDQVESFNKDFKKRWLLHTINEPKVEGNLTTVERADLCFRFTAWDKSLAHAVTAAADHPFFKEHPDCKWYGGYQPQLYQYDGVMFVRTLLPVKAEMAVIGGPGKECWVDGHNYVEALDGRPVSFRPYTGEGEAGRYRLEVSPPTAAENDLFLQVIQVGLKSRNPKATAATVINVPNGTGVEVDLQGGRRATILFKSGLGGRITIAEGGKTLVEQDLAETVMPNPRIPK